LNAITPRLRIFAGAEVTSGSDLEIKTDSVPAWFRNSVLSKYDQAG
jgi:hypothetical protein